MKKVKELKGVLRSDIIKDYRCVRRGQRINKDDICCYGTSLFQDRRILANKMYLPRPNKKICEGYVYKEGGPQLTDEEDSHINWWIYENADLTGFNFVQDLKR